jgi:ADP-heptose:LPS heptosyltransferase
MDSDKIKFGSSTGGLGDVLLLTSVCKYFPNQFIVQLTPKNSRLSVLFKGLADVEICEQSEIKTLQDIGAGHYATRKLRNFFGELADGMDNRPLVLYSSKEDEAWAYEFLKDKRTPVVFVPTCSKQWASVRNLPENVVFSNLKKIQESGCTAIVCQSSDNKIETREIELIDLPLGKYICLLRRCGFYMGANTGDEHLATAVGCKTVVIQPKDGNGFLSAEWNYDHPNSQYYTWHDDNSG